MPRLPFEPWRFSSPNVACWAGVGALDVDAGVAEDASGGSKNALGAHGGGVAGVGGMALLAGGVEFASGG